MNDNFIKIGLRGIFGYVLPYLEMELSRRSQSNPLVCTIFHITDLKGRTASINVSHKEGPIALVSFQGLETIGSKDFTVTYNYDTGKYSDDSYILSIARSVPNEILYGFLCNKVTKDLKLPVKYLSGGKVTLGFDGIPPLTLGGEDYSEYYSCEEYLDAKIKICDVLLNKALSNLSVYLEEGILNLNLETGDLDMKPLVKYKVADNTELSITLNYSINTRKLRLKISVPEQPTMSLVVPKKYEYRAKFCNHLQDILKFEYSSEEVEKAIQTIAKYIKTSNTDLGNIRWSPNDRFKYLLEVNPDILPYTKPDDLTVFA